MNLNVKYSTKSNFMGAYMSRAVNNFIIIFCSHLIKPMVKPHFCGIFSSRVSDVIADVMSVILFLLLLSYAVTIAICLTALNLVEPFGVAFFGFVASCFNLLMQLIIYCAFSENVTTDLYATGDIFYEFPWYRLPVDLQKLFILGILRAQSEFRLTGLGIIECSLKVFASVMYLNVVLSILFYIFYIYV